MRMTDLIFEPGVWASIALIGFALISLTASLLLRSSRRRFRLLVEEIIAENRLTAADKAWLRAEITRSKGRHLIVAAPFAPFAIFGAVAVGAYEGWFSKADEADDALERDIERMMAENVELSQGVDPRTGNYWRDERHREVRDLALTLETWNNPISMCWIVIWLMAATPFLLAGWLISGTVKPFVMNVWAPLREPVLAILSEVHRHRVA